MYRYTLTIRTVTKQKWSSAAHHQTQAYSEDKVWWGRKEAFIKMLHNQGKGLWLQANLVHKTQTKPICFQKVWNPKPCPEILLHPYVSFWGRRLLSDSSPLSLCVAPVLPMPQHRFPHQGPGATANHCGPLCGGSIVPATGPSACCLATWLPGPASPQEHWTCALVHVVPWIPEEEKGESACPSFKSPGTNFCMLQEHPAPPANLILFPG